MATNNSAYLNRFLRVARIEDLVEKLNHFLGAEPNDANAATHQTLLHHADALLELGAVFLECGALSRGLFLAGLFLKKSERIATAFDADDSRLDQRFRPPHSRQR